MSKKRKRRISKEEIGRRHAILFQLDKARGSQNRYSLLLGSDGQPINPERYTAMKRDEEMFNVILQKLYSDGIIKRTVSGYEIDASSRIETLYGEESGKPIREILVRVIKGLHVQGYSVKVGEVISRGFEGDDSDLQSDKMLISIIDAVRRPVYGKG